MEASLFDMDLDLLRSWDLSQLLGAPDVLVSEQARGLVLPGLSAGHWSSSGPSPVEEVQQDPLWFDPTDAISGSPELFNGQQQDDFSPQYKKFSTDFLFDEDCQTLPFTSDFLLSSDHISSPTSTLGTSPIDVKFEFGDVHSVDQTPDFLTDTSPRVIDNVFAQQTFPTFEHSTMLTPRRPAFMVGSYDERIPLVVDSAVPASPFTESCPSPLDSLEYDDDDSLHDAENVCQLLIALDGGVQRGAGGFHSTSLLSLVSAEEIESVLSRDSSFDNLVDLCDGSLMLADNSGSSCASMDLDFAASSGSSLQSSSSINSSSGFSSGCGFATSLPIQCGAAITTSSHLSFGTASTVSTSHLPTAQSSTVGGFVGVYSIASPAGSLPAVIGSEYVGASLAGKIDSSPCAGKSRAGPYGEVQVERRVRKKEQNKTAALRYRQKKREEKGHTMTEVEELEQQNQVLKNRADELSKEISYLRGLLEEITK